MMEKHPDLRVCFARMMFLSDDGPLLENLMERFPNLHLDITAGTEMYYNFTARPDFWKSFFRRYSSRIFYGTDNYNRPDENGRQIGDTINRMQKRFLTDESRFPLWQDEIQGFGLDTKTLENITCNSFRRFTSPQPSGGSALPPFRNRTGNFAPNMGIFGQITSVFP